MKVYVSNILNPKHHSGWDINNYDSLYNFCKLFNHAVKVDATKDFDHCIIDVINTPNEQYLFTVDKPSEPARPDTFFSQHMFVLEDFNNIQYYHDNMDKKLLCKIIQYMVYNNPSKAEYLLNRITRQWFDELTAQKCFDILYNKEDIESIKMADKLLRSKFWDIKNPDWS